MDAVSYATNPTKRTYDALDAAYTYFNTELFDGRLPHCLITLRHHHGTYGYFSAKRFASRDGAEHADEIALNARHFQERTPEQILSTLVHELVHCEQNHFGKPSRNGYHNKQWAAWMERVGLMPSSTGEPGGKRTGQRVSHFIVPGGPFARAYAAGSFDDLYVDRTQENGTSRRPKTSYTCPRCDAIVWGKPDLQIACIPCGVQMT